jgi:hypothetical protein
MSMFYSRSSVDPGVHFSCRYTDGQRTHFSELPDAHKIASYIFIGPIFASFGKIKGVSLRSIFLKNINCCPSFSCNTIFG